MASLMQALVCIKVPQLHGGEIEEFVSMEKLDTVHRSIKQTFSNYRDSMPLQRKINKIEAAPVKTRYFEFPETITSRRDKHYHIVAS